MKIQGNIANEPIKNNIETKPQESTLEAAANTKETGMTDNKESNKLSKDFTAISKDGDTLELSDKKVNEKSDEPKIIISDKIFDRGGSRSVTMSAAALAKCSKARLKQLLSEEKITKQQYARAIKSQSNNEINTSI